MKYQEFITDTLTAASKIATANFGKTTATVKVGDNNQVLTETDLAVGKLIVEQITQIYPEHNVIDEETGVIDNDSNFTWVVDPIDGTSNFATGLPHFGIMIGLLESHQPIAGGLALPAFEALYVAEQGGEATCNGQVISVSKETELSNCLVAYGIDGYQADPERTRRECKTLAELVLKIRNLRTSNSAFDMAMTIEGKYAAVVNRTTKVWDNVALHALAEAAGGAVCDLSGQAIDYSLALRNPEANYEIVIAPPALQSELIEIFKG